MRQVLLISLVVVTVVFVFLRVARGTIQSCVTLQYAHQGNPFESFYMYLFIRNVPYTFISEFACFEHVNPITASCLMCMCVCRYGTFGVGFHGAGIKQFCSSGIHHPRKTDTKKYTHTHTHHRQRQDVENRIYICVHVGFKYSCPTQRGRYLNRVVLCGWIT